MATGMDVYAAPSTLKLPRAAVFTMMFKKCRVIFVLGGVKSARDDKTVISFNVCSVEFRMIISGSAFTLSQFCVIMYCITQIGLSEVMILGVLFPCVLNS